MLKEVMDIIEYVDRSNITGAEIIKLFDGFPYVEASTVKVEGDKGFTDFVKIIIHGTDGKTVNGKSPTMGVIGRLGGIGARPSQIGMVSDADGAITALAVALKLAKYAKYGDRLPGDVIVTTHICPDAPTEPHEPVDFMDSPVDMDQMNEYEVVPETDAILTIDTTKGNNLFSNKGFAISPVVKEGYILRVCQHLANIMEISTGLSVQTFPISMLDITPYSNNLFHINSILQPATATNAPVVGVAITTQSVVPGCATGASHEVDIAEAAQFIVEACKEFTAGKFKFYDEVEFEKLVKLYGKMNIFQTNPELDS